MIELNFSKTLDKTPKKEAEPVPVKIGDADVYWATANPFYTMLGNPDVGGRANDLWITDGTPGGSQVLKVNPDDGRRIANCGPQTVDNFDGGFNLQATNYDMDGDGDFDQVELINVRADFTYEVLANITRGAPADNISCSYSVKFANGVKLILVNGSGASSWNEYWRTDGTVAGTYALGGGNNGGYGNINDSYKIGETLYMTVTDGINKVIARTNGSNFELMPAPATKPYPWGNNLSERFINGNYYIWDYTDDDMVHIDSSGNVHHYTRDVSAHTNVNFIDGAISLDGNTVMLSSYSPGMFNDLYLNKADGKFYPVGNDLMGSNELFAVRNDGAYYYEDLGGGNYIIKRSTDMTTLTVITTINSPVAPTLYWDRIGSADRVLAYEIGGEEYIYDFNDHSIRSPVLGGACSEDDFNPIEGFGGMLNVVDDGYVYYACTAMPAVAFAKYSLTDHSTDVYADFNVMTEMSNENSAMAFVHSFLLNYFDVIKFYDISDGQVIGASPFN